MSSGSGGGNALSVRELGQPGSSGQEVTSGTQTTVVSGKASPHTRESATTAEERVGFHVERMYGLMRRFYWDIISSSRLSEVFWFSLELELVVLANVANK